MHGLTSGLEFGKIFAIKFPNVVFLDCTFETGVIIGIRILY